MIRCHTEKRRKHTVAPHALVAGGMETAQVVVPLLSRDPALSFSSLEHEHTRTHTHAKTYPSTWGGVRGCGSHSPKREFRKHSNPVPGRSSGSVTGWFHSIAIALYRACIAL